MDPIEMLKMDHRKVEGLFEEFEGLESGGSRQRQAIVKQVLEELTLHAELEEKIVYPFLREQVPDLEDEVLEAYEEHRVVKNTLADLRRTKAGDERLKAKMKVLKENVKHHVEEEESELLPKLQESCSEEELMELGERLEAARRSGGTRSRGKRRGTAKTTARRPRDKRRAA